MMSIFDQLGMAPNVVSNILMSAPYSSPLQSRWTAYDPQTDKWFLPHDGLNYERQATAALRPWEAMRPDTSWNALLRDAKDRRIQAALKPLKDAMRDLRADLEARDGWVR